MFTTIDMKNFPRREHYYFFKEYDNPFFNICTDVDVTHVREQVKKLDLSYFSVTLFLSLKAANEIEEMRYRILDDKLVCYDVINGGSTVFNEDHTFSFCFFTYDHDFSVFNRGVEDTLEKNRHRGSSLDEEGHDLDLIHYSVIPWISFKSLSHPRNYNSPDSVPKIVFGRYYERGGRLIMPLAVDVHHSLMDGYHVGLFLQRFQDLLNDFSG